MHRQFEVAARSKLIEALIGRENIGIDVNRSCTNRRRGFDLGASGTIERIISFLVVGSLLVATGYFSPLPQKQPDHSSDSGETSHA